MVKGKGEDDLDENWVKSLTEETSDGGDEGDLPGTGVDVPEDSALLKLKSETDRLSVAPSTECEARVLFIIGEVLVPNCGHY